MQARTADLCAKCDTGGVFCGNRSPIHIDEELLRLPTLLETASSISFWFCFLHHFSGCSPRGELNRFQNCTPIGLGGKTLGTRVKFRCRRSSAALEGLA